jgi:hypothetical protein
VAPPQLSREERRPSQAGARLPPAAWLAAAGAFALVVLALRRRGKGAARPHPAAGFLDAIDARLVAARVPRLPGEGLEELSQRLSKTRHPLAGPLAEARRRYLEARFGGRPLLPGEQRALLGGLAP